jgi:serine/threonine kinase PknH
MNGKERAAVRASGTRQVGPYRLEDILGEGATGIVHRAVDAEGRQVALKIVRQELYRDPVYRRRLAQEVRAAREIRHRHIVTLLDSGESDGVMYIAFELCPDGQTLEARLQVEGALPPTLVVRMALQLGSAVDALHDYGIVHRDIKPSNIIVSGEEFLLTDFGLAKGRAYTLLTRPGRVLGTVDYLAPELIRGERATPAADIYAFGCTVYACVTGHPPFAGRSMIAVGLAHLDELPPDPATLTPDLPRDYSLAVLRALEKEPASRPSTATAYARILQIALKEVR